MQVVWLYIPSKPCFLDKMQHWTQQEMAAFSWKQFSGISCSNVSGTYNSQLVYSWSLIYLLTGVLHLETVQGLVPSANPHKYGKEKYFSWRRNMDYTQISCQSFLTGALSVQAKLYLIGWNSAKEFSLGHGYRTLCKSATIWEKI